MQFIPLPNFIKILKLATSKTTLNYIDITNVSRTLYQPWTWVSSSVPTFTNVLSFFANKVSNYTSATEQNMYVRASSDTNIQDYVPENIVGACSCSVTENSGSNGWTMVITVTGNEGETINSLYFTRKLWYGGNGGESAEAVLFALIFDKPVTIDSTGTAHFTFAIEF